MKNGNMHSAHRERLRQRYLSEGADAFEDHVLLELFLFDVVPRCDTNPIAHRLIERFGSLDGVLRASSEEFMTVVGVGKRTAEYICEKWNEKCAETEKAIVEKPLVSYERAVNYFIWHRLATGHEGVTAVYLDEMMFIKRVVDVPCVKALVRRAYKDEKNVIVCADSADGVQDKIHDSVRLLDVISVNGYDAVSLTGK